MLLARSPSLPNANERIIMPPPHNLPPSFLRKLVNGRVVIAETYATEVHDRGIAADRRTNDESVGKKGVSPRQRQPRA